ncbi:hypothetical protein [Actinomadura keratinilytica]|jgi:hypothetical protein|uniref:GTPase activator n=1 Tax=Actinomadura keratinilytica TaxID=547461 RepID=A0ABP7ZAB5_9ACTN
MTEREDLGHEPEETRDKRFAPVTRGGDARGRTDADRPPEAPGEGGTLPREQGMARQEDEVSGTGVPGVDVGQPDALPPDEEGVREAERRDDSR